MKLSDYWAEVDADDEAQFEDEYADTDHQRGMTQPVTLEIFMIRLSICLRERSQVSAWADPRYAGCPPSSGQCHQNLLSFLARHSAGDWGDLCDEDRELNDSAV